MKDRQLGARSDLGASGSSADKLFKKDSHLPLSDQHSITVAQFSLSTNSQLDLVLAPLLARYQIFMVKMAGSSIHLCARSCSYPRLWVDVILACLRDCLLFIEMLRCTIVPRRTQGMFLVYAFRQPSVLQ